VLELRELPGFDRASCPRILGIPTISFQSNPALKVPYLTFRYRAPLGYDFLGPMRLNRDFYPTERKKVPGSLPGQSFQKYATALANVLDSNLLLPLDFPGIQGIQGMHSCIMAVKHTFPGDSSTSVIDNRRF